MRTAIKVLMLLGVLSFIFTVRAEESEVANPMVLHPDRYIKITDFSVYSARGVAIIHHVTVENSSDIAYKNIRVRVRYNSTSYTNYGTEVATETGILPITLPPHSKKTYLEGGATLGATSSSYYASRIEVLGAIPLTAGD
ncbi:MAG TPA: hypothetical protein VLB01_01650 [Thermodesulfobacteriota bacterium]|nr:hypothetical protein [Thermodesulfobacteriota bacterium]